MNQSDFWIIRPFNPVFCGAFALFILLLIAASLLMRGRSDRAKRAVIAVACILTLIGFFVYKYFLSIDAEYDVITKGMGGFNWWGELPLQLCNINMILIPVAVLRKSRPLMSFGFFLGPLGALMALIMPSTGFEGYSLLLPRMLGYYGTHFMIFTEGPALAVLGLYRPRFRDLPKTVLCAVGITFVIFWFNMLLRHTGLHPKANYFFAVETEGNPLLSLFYGWIPVTGLYLIPCIGILAVYMGLVTSGFFLAGKLGRKRKA
jgi:uncharacterized membrane protein YwaF